MTTDRAISRRRRGAAALLAALLTLAAAGAAAAALCWSIPALHDDLTAVAGTSTTLIHLLVAALGVALAWSGLVLAASTVALTRVTSSSDLAPPGGERRTLSHHLAALLLAATGAVTLGSAPAATAAPLPPPVVLQAAPAKELTTAMALPLPAADDLPQPGWVTPPPSPISQRCKAGARLIAGLVTRNEPSEVVVHRGDSLWSLVSRYLQTDDACVISAVWPQWYAANRTVIGDDPDLLLVGQRLRIPSADLNQPSDRTTQGDHR